MPTLQWLRQLCDSAHVPLGHEAKALRQRDELARHQLWQDPPLDAGGLPVLLVGGMGASALLLGPLHDLLHRLNCRVLVAPTRLSMGCGQVASEAVQRALLRLVSATGRPAVVVAHSRGGHFARTAVVRNPELVRGLITLGSPLTRPLAVRPALRAQLTALSLAGGLGVPGLLRPGCLTGRRCCAPLREAFNTDFPAAVRFLSIYSQVDSIIDWRSCLDPAARHRDIPVGHGELLWAPASLAAVAHELAETVREDCPAAGRAPLPAAA